MAKILLMEDDAMQSQLLADVLEADGHEVDVKSDARSAIAHFKAAGQFDLVVTDVFGRSPEPPGEGYELISFVRSEDAAAETTTPIISISGLALQEGDGPDGAPLPVSNVHLVKPFSIKELLDVVGKLLMGAGDIKSEVQESN